MMVRTMSSEEARTQWRTLLDLTGQGDVDVVIERHGKATVAVISYELYQAMQGVIAELRGEEERSLRGQRMGDALQTIAQLKNRARIDDPVQWQIEQRAERSLADRDA